LAARRNTDTLQGTQADQEPAAGCWRGAARDRQSTAVPCRCWTRLPDAQPAGADTLRRRVAAHPACQPDRQRTDGRPLRPGRADDRVASARQPPVAAGPDALTEPG